VCVYRRRRRKEKEKRWMWGGIDKEEIHEMPKVRKIILVLYSSWLVQGGYV
jgi:hypothetical protein